MKSRFSTVAVLFMLAGLTNCKKDEAVKSNLPLDRNDLAVTVMAASGVAVNTVVTIAGAPYTSGPTLANGNSKTARFNNPFGIQLMEDGTIYVADTDNDLIRVVSPANDVTTFNIPDRTMVDPYFFSRKPKYIGIDNNRVVYIVDYLASEQHDRMTLYTPEGNAFYGYASMYYDAKELVKDPYGNYFWTIFGNQINKISSKKSNFTFTEEPLKFTNRYLPDEPGYYTFPALFAGYNGVIYFTYKGKLYKHSKDNTGSVIFSDLTFGNVTCIVANKDSRTLYIADNGYIKRIDNGKLTVVAGPNKTFTDSRDGLGPKADVYAQYMALSKDETTIYFSDSRADAIRKVILK